MWIAKNNDLIILAKNTREELEQALQFIVYTSIAETNKDYELYEGDYLTREEVEAKRQDEINHLTMTALDFITVLRSAGLTLEQINLVIESNLEVKMQLTYCQNVFCGVVKQFLPMTVGDITITPEMIEQAFIAKHNSSTEEV